MGGHNIMGYGMGSSASYTHTPCERKSTLRVFSFIFLAGRMNEMSAVFRGWARVGASTDDDPYGGLVFLALLRRRASSTATTHARAIGRSREPAG